MGYTGVRHASQTHAADQFLYRNGTMRCAQYDGCWRSRLPECDFKSKDGQPMCMELIRPEDVARSIELYYLGGRLKPMSDPSKPVILSQKKGTEEPKKQEEVKV